MPYQCYLLIDLLYFERGNILSKWYRRPSRDLKQMSFTFMDLICTHSSCFQCILPLKPTAFQSVREFPDLLETLERMTYIVVILKMKKTQATRGIVSRFSLLEPMKQTPSKGPDVPGIHTVVYSVLCPQLPQTYFHLLSHDIPEPFSDSINIQQSHFNYDTNDILAFTTVEMTFL